jgi:hypothetical protein
MRLLMSDPDLFGCGDGQRDLFPEATPQPGRIVDFPAEARRRLLKMLAEARAAERLPWSEKETRTLEILFPQMAGWLPEDEAKQLCFEFAQEVERLRQAA